jgi:amino acid transporter
VVVTYATSIGYGVRAATTAWPASAGGLSALTVRYAPHLDDWVLLAGGLAALFSGLGAHNAVARLLYAMGREGVAPRVLGRTHRIHKTPHIAIVLNLVFMIVVAGVVIGSTGQSSRDAVGASPGPLSFGFYLFAQASTMSIPLLLLCWALLSVASIRFHTDAEGSGLRTARRIAISSGALLASTTALFGSLYYSFNEVAPDAGILGPYRIVPQPARAMPGAPLLARRRRASSDDMGRSVGGAGPHPDGLPGALTS